MEKEQHFILLAGATRLAYLGAFSMLFIIPIAMLIGLIFKYLYSREEKDFLRKYGKEKDISTTSHSSGRD